MYLKDQIQIRELGKSAKKILTNVNSKNDIDREIQNYKKEMEYWTKEYFVQLQIWEDEGGFIPQENLVEIDIEEYYG